MNDLKRCVKLTQDIRKAVSDKSKELEALLQRKENLLPKSLDEILEHAKRERDHAVKKYASGEIDKKKLDIALLDYNKAVIDDQTTKEVIEALDDSIDDRRRELENLNKEHKKADQAAWLELGTILTGKIKGDSSFQTLVQEAFAAMSLGRGFYIHDDAFCQDLFEPKKADLRELEKAMRKKYLS